MWYSEVHRIGFRKCTPVGYNLLVLGGYFYFFAFLLTVGAIMVAPLGWYDFRAIHLIYILALLVTGFIGKTTAHTLASRRNFEYHYEPDESTWGVDRLQRFTHAEWESDYLSNL